MVGSIIIYRCIAELDLRVVRQQVHCVGAARVLALRKKTFEIVSEFRKIVWPIQKCEAREKKVFSVDLHMTN